jgi:hypothetical protein
MKDIYQVANDVYASVFELLSEHETRGFNAHHRAQVIAKSVTEQCEQWIELQTKPQPGQGEGGA